MCADAAIVLEAVRGNKGFGLFLRQFVTQFRVHKYGVQVQNTLYQKIAAAWPPGVLIQQYLENVLKYFEPVKKISRDILKMVGTVAQIPSLQLQSQIYRNEKKAEEKRA